MSFEDYRGAWPKAQLTPRNTQEQVHGARAACARYVRDNAGCDVEALRELIEMLGLERTVAEIAAEREAVAADPEAADPQLALQAEYQWAQNQLDAAAEAEAS